MMALPYSVKTTLQKPVSKLQLAGFSTLYFFLLNAINSKDLAATFFYAIWPALLTFCILALLSITHRYLLKIISIFLVFITAFCVFFKYKYNIIITEDIVLSAWANDVSLSVEMISVNLCMWMLITAILPSLYILKANIEPNTFIRQIVVSCMAIILALGAILSIFLIQDFEIRKAGQIRDPKIANSLSYFSPVDALYSARNAWRSMKQYHKQYANITQLSKTYHYQQTPDLNDLLVVVVVGETARGDRFSLNGYHRNTNPQLAKIRHLYSFANATSCNTITLRSMKCIFSRVDANSRTTGITESAFTDVMKNLGFTIDIYSLQGMNDIYNYLGYNRLVSKYAVLRTSTVGAKDLALLPFLEKSIAEEKGKHLIILHTLGSHQTYNDRLLPQHKVFTPSCSNADVEACTPESLNNAYDNSIIATDDFLAKTIQLLQNKKAILIYASDHGESLGENGIYYHGIPPDKAPKEQFSIPLMIWLSDAVIATKHGKQMQKHIANRLKNTGYSHDNFFHSVLGCAGIFSNNGGMNEMLNLCHTTSY